MMLIHSVDGNNGDGDDSANVDNGDEDVNRTGVEMMEICQ